MPRNSFIIYISLRLRIILYGNKSFNSVRLCSLSIIKSLCLFLPSEIRVLQLNLHNNVRDITTSTNAATRNDDDNNKKEYHYLTYACIGEHRHALSTCSMMMMMMTGV